MDKRWCVFRGLFIFMITILLSGCVVLAPFIQAWKNVGASEADRIVLFNQRIKRFGEALYWSKGEAALYVDSDADASVRKNLTMTRENIRVVESRIKDVTYEDNAFTAQVEFVVRYYRIPYYIVLDETEKQVWKFHIGDNWYLLKREMTKEFQR